MPEIAAKTDLIAFVPKPLAQSLAERLALHIFDPPVPIAPTSLSMTWHARVQNDPANRWFRALIRRVTRNSGFGEEQAS
jgi:DNA-binding transcriptional LysR family regulator